MKLTYTSLKNLLNNSQSINISDSLPFEIIMRLAEEAGKEEKKLIIRVKKLGVEDLKRISKAAKGNISFYIEEEQEDKFD